MVIGNPPYIERVLEVNRGELCYIIGTIYMEMPLKPNVMDDIASDVSALGLCLAVSNLILNS